MAADGVREAVIRPSLTFPWTEPPSAGSVTEVAPGILWFRLPLPYRLDHVNIYLLRDGAGWAAVDCGLGDEACRLGWQSILNGPLQGERLTRLIVTHFHPDHVGLARWLAETHGVPLAMPRTEYLYSMALQHPLGDRDSELSRRFYRTHGLPDAIIDEVLSNGLDYLKRTTGVSSTYTRLRQGQELRIGGRTFQVLTSGGHAMEQAMLYSAQDRLFLSADQVIARISPNIGVYSIEPSADPLAEYLRSLRMLIDTIPPDVLTLPGHGLPFIGLHVRAEELIAHHLDRCRLILAACIAAPLSASDLIPVMFTRPLDAHQTSFAFVEVLAHANYLVGREELAVESIDGINRFRVAR